MTDEQREPTWVVPLRKNRVRKAATERQDNDAKPRERDNLPKLMISGSDPTATAKDLAALIAKRVDFLFNGHAPVRIADEAGCLPRALEVTTEGGARPRT